MGEPLRLVIAGELESPHFRRWCRQLGGSGWDVHLVQAHWRSPPRLDGYEGLALHLPQPLPAPDGATVRLTTGAAGESLPPEVFAALPEAVRAEAGKRLARLHALGIARLLAEVRPHVLHSHGLNVNWRNLLLPVADALDTLPPGERPRWLYSTWGSDLDFYPRTGPEQRAGVLKVLPRVDALVTECHRDWEMACDMGFGGGYAGMLPAFGGVAEEVFAQPFTPLGQRRLVLVKGRDDTPPGGDPVGRARVALAALHRCRRLLAGYRVAVFQPSPAVVEMARQLAADGMDIVLLGRVPYAALLAHFAAARIFVAMTVNDGLPSALCEALALGAVPVHSDLPSVAEWVRHGRNGMLAPANDVDAVAACLSKALADDAWAAQAQSFNRYLALTRLHDAVVRDATLHMYRRVADGRCLAVGRPAPAASGDSANSLTTPGAQA